VIAVVMQTQLAARGAPVRQVASNPRRFPTSSKPVRWGASWPRHRAVRARALPWASPCLCGHNSTPPGAKFGGLDDRGSERRATSEQPWLRRLADPKYGAARLAEAGALQAKGRAIAVDDHMRTSRSGPALRPPAAIRRTTRFHAECSDAEGRA
jgi:hypothetical protein